ncbi:YfkD family protein [Lentibacillus sp. N15]|uniref:YfkD famly protein n=1 Tax=Lentibacillus songyuanensis TaxID=3136161 RepID=UPI0031BBAFFD
MGHMKRKKVCQFVLLVMVCSLLFPLNSFAAEKKKSKDDFKVPSHALNISKENTFPNSTEDQEIVEPSKATKELIDGVNVPIKNPDLIKMLNETSVKPSFFAVGYRGMVYLGRWPVNYKSLETTINWQYQQINENELNNMGGDTNQKMNYIQKEQKEVKGALTNKIAKPDDIKKMMLLEAKDKTKLPLAYKTVIGSNTKKDNSYAVPTEKVGNLKAYAPAVSEKGQVTFGEVYLKLKGNKKSIEIKNVTKQGIGAWVPIQDYVSFSFNLQ